MGAVCSGGADRETVENRRIQQEMAVLQRKDAVTVKLLLLGAGDSGKTTLRKQMRNLYGEGFSAAVRRQLGPVVIGNLIDGAKTMVNAVEELGVVVESEETQAAMKRIADLRERHILDDATAAAFNTMWADAQFKSVWHRRKEFQIQDCWLTFADECAGYPEWGGGDWVPSISDSIVARVRTSGIVTESFDMEGVTFNVYDVGGQRAERRKWIHCFDNVTAMIFVASLAEYDQVLYEDRKKNRLRESLELFQEVANSDFFDRVPVLLFLNKRDLFQQKYGDEGVPLNVSGEFPEAPEGLSVGAAIDWLSAKYRSLRTTEGDVYHHVTTATDAGNVKTVMETARTVILERNLEISGFYH